tara:strand:- start:316 stop:717 length:402 start_codon:yes stop_codon:yes gene_type:complete
MLLRARKQLAAPPDASKPAPLEGKPCTTVTPPKLATLTTLATLGHDCQPASPSFCVIGCLAGHGHAGNCFVKDDDGALSRVPLSIKRKWVVWKGSGCPEADENEPADGDAPATPKRPRLLANALAQQQMPISA